MKHILVSLLRIAVGAFGLVNIESARELYTTLYPAGVARADSIDYCTDIGLTFDKLTEAQREARYARTHRPLPAVRVSSPMQR